MKFMNFEKVIILNYKLTNINKLQNFEKHKIQQIKNPTQH